MHNLKRKRSLESSNADFDVKRARPVDDYVLPQADSSPAAAAAVAKTHKHLKLSIKTPTGESIVELAHHTLDVSVLKVKSWIERSEEIPPCQQILLFAGEPLRDDENILHYYDIKRDSTLELVLQQQQQQQQESADAEPHPATASL
jgi:hypothetical protein